MRSLPIRAVLRRGVSAGIALLATVACQSGRPAVEPAPVRDSVNVGYGTQAKRDVTGSVAAVDGATAQRSSPTSVADMIDGRFPGVDVQRLPNGGMSVRIRGSRSLKSNGEPLIVVDGIPQHASTTGVLNDIDPGEVASIEVLRDAGSTAIYGARGANGVILITRKRP